MARIDDTTKKDRLDRIYLILSRNPRGLNEAEIAQEVNLERRTANNYLRELEEQGKAFKDGVYWFPLVLRESRLRSFDLSPEEAVTLYLGARLLVKQQDKRNEPAETALLKLASVLKADAGVGDEIEQAARELAQRPVQDNYQPIFREIVRGYIYRKKVEITYRPLNWDKGFQTTFSTYLLEPSPIGFSTYLIGYSSIVNAMRAYKLERIESARMVKDDYSIPPDFPGLEVLRNAWSVITGKETVRVVLRFNEKVKSRVLETRWHPSQQTREDLETPGSLLWEIQVADTLDLKPWIRGWGADCEVLEPKELREEITQHVRDLATQYKVITPEIKPFSTLWAKTDRKDQNKVHRLVYHLIDVGQVALAMWNKALDSESQRQFCRWLDCDEGTAGRTLAFLISLHDVGKASPDFQIKVASVAQEVARAGFTFPRMRPPNSVAHGVISAGALRELLQSELNVSKPTARVLAQAVGGHHGAWIRPVDWQAAHTDNTGSAEWDTARTGLTQAMLNIFNPRAGFDLPEDDKELNTFLTLFSGFTSVADWIGSMTEYFPYEKNVNLPLGEYASRAASSAEKALTELGWFGWQADGTTLTFKEMFPFITTPNSVQQRIVSEVMKTSLPALLILESPTGSGKTEAALYAADTWLQAQRGNGMYIAMPTQATSNQMYDRVTKFLRQRYPEESLNLHLVHGGALLQDAAQTENIYDDDKSDSLGGIRAETWFLPRKRTLLAPFGVGTIDQALMSVLQTRHFFVRMFGLQNKVVVFDEVHAYDTYMSELFKRLLAWLKQIGASVVLLSATLPEETRHDLTAAYLGEETVNLPSTQYPRLTIASGTGIKSIALDTPLSRTIVLEPCDTQPQDIIEHVRTALQHGGCAAVICNRVKRAQELYKEIQAAKLVPDEDLILFHARFPFAWREEIETSILNKFGKGKDGGHNPNRPHKSIVVATQVIEQSLDLDFDYMVSDLAPIDLLIQRAGRLHRHGQNDATRPENVNSPTLLVAFPQAKDIPHFGDDEYVYERSIMLKTWLALKGKTALRLPEETTALIESVYGGEVEIPDEALRKEMEDAIQKAAKNERSEIFKADTCLIYEPNKEDLLSQRNNQLEEDDPTVHRAFRAMTRSADTGVSLICLHRVNGVVCLDPEGATPLDLSAKPDKELTKQLLRQNVNVQNRMVVNFFMGKSEPAWKEVAALKFTIPVIFENGRFVLEGERHTINLDRNIGLTLQKEEQ
ncbi:MAG: CRISPR-associated helicase Cas3' [Chloroflexi bacterium]|nr:CRISPR-associated helicase Cas3' [Chloroflexota bacterium]